MNSTLPNPFLGYYPYVISRSSEKEALYCTYAMVLKISCTFFASLIVNPFCYLLKELHFDKVALLRCKASSEAERSGSLMPK